MVCCRLMMRFRVVGLIVSFLHVTFGRAVRLVMKPRMEPPVAVAQPVEQVSEDVIVNPCEVLAVNGRAVNAEAGKRNRMLGTAHAKTPRQDHIL